ncbi:MAG: hypothetical protein ACJ76H_03845 [Bacteriovoracaceae bacterium]
MKKFIANLCSFAFVLNVFTVSGTTSAFAAEKSQSSNKQELIADIFAKYSMTMEKAEGQVKAFTEASLAIKENNISNDDLVAYAISDMNPAEAKAFLANAAQMNNKNLSPEEAAKLVLNTQNQGSNFRTCMLNDDGITGFIAGTGAFVVGILAIVNITYSNKNKRNDIKLARVQEQEEIDILLGEGVSEGSYLVTSRRADIAYMDEQERQLEEQEADKHKEGMIEGAVAAALLLVTALNIC